MLNSDSTFQATSWPEMWCGGTTVETADQLHGMETLDFHGTWEEGAVISQNSITLYPNPAQCAGSYEFADFRSEDGVKYMCMLLDVDTDMPSLENWFILYLGDPEATPKSDRCFSYN